MMLTLAVFYSIPSCDLQMLFHLPKSATDCLKGINGINGVSGGGASGGGGGSSNPVASGSSGRHGGAPADPERIRLQTAGAGRGPKYTQQMDEQDDEEVNRCL